MAAELGSMEEVQLAATAVEVAAGGWRTGVQLSIRWVAGADG